METSRTPVFRRYDILEKIGSGGMGAVYRARDTHLNRVVALKVLPPALQDDGDVLERFKREAHALARLKHPRVAAVFDAHVEGGFPHLVMELVEGDTLERHLKRRRRLTAEETARIGIDIAEALDHIHTHRIVHRDVKSSNIIMEPRIGAVLADFGIALEASLPRISQGALGTPEYMSPEQAQGRDVDGRSDLYGLGAVLFECLIGRTPFRRTGDSFASLMTLMKQVTEEPVPPLQELRADIPTWMADLVARCLEKDPDRRFATAVELSSALRAGLREAGARLLVEPTIAADAVDPAAADDDGPLASDEAGWTSNDDDGPAANDEHGQAARSPADPRRPRRLRFVYSDRSKEASASDGGDADLRKSNADDTNLAFRIGRDPARRREMMVITHVRPVQSVAFGPEGRRMASASDDGIVRVWQVADGKLLHALEAHEGSVSAVTFSPDGRRIASGDIFGKICVWDAATGRLVRTIDALTALVMALAFSPDGKTLVSGGADRAVRLWNVRNGHLNDTVGWHLGYVLAAAFSPDGGRVATSGSDGQVLIWNRARKQISVRIQAHRGWAVGIDFSPDGKRLVSGGSDRKVNIWDAEQGTLVHELSGSTSGLMATVFSPNGRIVAGAGRDRIVRLWDAHSGRLVERLTGHAGAVTALAFSRSGRHLASGGDDRTARIWHLDRKRFASRRPLRRALSWSAAASLALVLLVGPLNFRQMDLNAAWTHIENALPNLSGAALEGSLFPRRNASETGDPSERQGGTQESDAIAQFPALPEVESGRRSAKIPSNRNERTRPATPRATELIGVKKPNDRLPAGSLDIPKHLESEPFHPLYSPDGFVSSRAGWTIIVGSLRSLRGAKWLVEHYRDLGLRAGIIAVPAGGAWEYLIGVGQFPQREEAEHAARRLRGRELPFRTQVDRLRWEYVTAERR